MSEKTFTQKEVIEMMTSVISYCQNKLAGYNDFYEWGYSRQEFGEDPGQMPNMYDKIYGSVLTLIESSIDSERVESTKSIAKQLINSAKMKHCEELHNEFCGFINNDFVTEPLKKAAKILHK